jgi:hypothetical protein
MSMAKRSRQIDDGTARLALAIVDLRAHFEAQLRTVTRAEQALAKCRGASDAVSFDAAAEMFRGEVQAVVGNRRSAGDLLEQIVADARELAFRARD